MASWPMVHGLAAIVNCADLRDQWVRFLDLYDAMELAGASRASKRLALGLPWFQELYWVSPGDYVRLRMDLPPFMFRAVRKLPLEWWYEGSHRGPDPCDALFDTFIAHMQYARKYLPNLDCVDLWVSLTGEPLEDWDPDPNRVDRLVSFLQGVAHVRQVLLDLRDTEKLHVLELRDILGCLRSSSHTSLDISLRSSTPSLAAFWSEGHDADKWSALFARFLKGPALPSLQSLRICMEVPQVDHAGINVARRSLLKVSPSTAKALNEQFVVYVNDGKEPLKDASGKVLPPGPYYAWATRRNLSCTKSREYIELYDSQRSAREARRWLSRGQHVGRQRFTPARGGPGGLGSLALPSHRAKGRGVCRLASVLCSLPDLSVTLEGSGFQTPALSALPNVDVRLGQTIEEEEPVCSDSDSSSSSARDSSSSSSL